jgi:hypothetical protein
MNKNPLSYISKMGSQKTSDNLYYVNFKGDSMKMAWLRPVVIVIVSIFLVVWLFLFLYCLYSYITSFPGWGDVWSYVNYHPGALNVQK